jgi:hypothetical protein
MPPITSSLLEVYAFPTGKSCRVRRKVASRTKVESSYGLLLTRRVVTHMYIAYRAQGMSLDHSKAMRCAFLMFGDDLGSSLVAVCQASAFPVELPPFLSSFSLSRQATLLPGKPPSFPSCYCLCCLILSSHHIPRLRTTMLVTVSSQQSDAPELIAPAVLRHTRQRDRESAHYGCRHFRGLSRHPR